MQPQQTNWQVEPQPSPDYSFLNEQPPAPKRPLIPVGNSLVVRIGIAAVGLILLIIIFSVVKGLLGGSKNFDSFVSIAQQQQGIIHLATNASEPASSTPTNLSESMQNFIITTQLSMTSDQSRTISYLNKNHVKVKTKVLNAGIHTSLDSQLDSAAAANNYSSTLKQIMHDQIQNYMQSLQTTYAHTSGPNGRKLLSEEYDHAKLLLDQLDQPG